MMKMNRILAITLTLLCITLGAATASAQGNVAVSVRNGTADPAQCQSSSINIFLNRTSGLLKFCTASNTWTSVLPATGGTVTGSINLGSNSLTFDTGDNQATLVRNASGGVLIRAYTAAPTALTGTIAAGAGVNAGTHSYKVTFVTAGGETGAGAVSNTVTTAGGNLQVNLTGIPLGNVYVTQRKIYRSAAGNAVTGPWLLQSTIADNTTTTLSDNTADASLTTTVPSTNTAIDTRAAFANDGSIALTGPLSVGRVLASGFLPTASATGAGGSPTVAVAAGSSDYAGTVVTTAGAGAAALGTLVVTFSTATAYGSNPPICVGILRNSTASWNARASLILNTATTTSATFNWDNNAVALVNASSYGMSYVCVGR